MKPGGSFEPGAAGEVEYFSARNLSGLGQFRHWFLSRRTGRSTGPFATLNLGYGNGDDDGVVAGNRRSAWTALGLSREPLGLKQSHADGVVVVEEQAGGLAGSPPVADAYITANRGIPLMVLTADCFPVVVCDARTPALGVVHAGWRGTALGITRKAVGLMAREFGTKPGECLAAMGPGIAPECYTVGEDVRAAFLRGFPWGTEVLRPAEGGGWKADLREANLRQLVEAGLPASAVAVCPYCTHCEAEHFFSARRDGPKSGRQASVAMTV